MSGVIQLKYLRLYMACLETVDVGSHIANIMKVNLAQTIVVKFPQLKSKVIMTDRWRDMVSEKRKGIERIFSIPLIHFHKLHSIYPSMRGYLDIKSRTLSLSEYPEIKQQREERTTRCPTDFIQDLLEALVTQEGIF